jgi:hypothetical protein
MLPADARTAFGFHTFTVPGKQMTPLAPKASADRRIVPRFPGSWIPASSSIRGVGPAFSRFQLVAWHQQNIDVPHVIFEGVRRFFTSGENAIHAQARAKGFCHQVRAFDSDQPSFVSFRMSECFPQFLQPRVLLTLYNAYRHLCEPTSA